jgi:hypothetical protein
MSPDVAASAAVPSITFKPGTADTDFDCRAVSTMDRPQQTWRASVIATAIRAPWNAGRAIRPHLRFQAIQKIAQHIPAQGPAVQRQRAGKREVAIDERVHAQAPAFKIKLRCLRDGQFYFFRHEPAHIVSAYGCLHSWILERPIFP